ncbi:MAG: hypothetical protein N0E55_10345 [Candidatus Thiodiazotropha taylori]|nr:hypothetical protein [Candidatus Thiodiazotropha taylori]MCG8096744.1 hypothetical protein [Candidatus Thiodiazotropha endolucinida]MCG8105537.1 hypothetical protein [Candidatus Thiodiazotropha taylori]MCG8111227.1 hypothetical protein [Candidatus Thiodiazotropha taylori]MCG8124345.1 hypothetical protein [Candidatus Thiodiazotropha taylori]
MGEKAKQVAVFMRAQQQKNMRKESQRRTLRQNDSTKSPDPVIGKGQEQAESV